MVYHDEGGVNGVLLTAVMLRVGALGRTNLTLSRFPFLRHSSTGTAHVSAESPRPWMMIAVASCSATASKTMGTLSWSWLSYSSDMAAVVMGRISRCFVENEMVKDVYVVWRARLVVTGYASRAEVGLLPSDPYRKGNKKSVCFYR